MPSKDRAMQAIFDAVDASRNDIIEVGRAIHANPETAGNEQQTAERVIAYLQQRGFEIEQGIGNVPMAFRARRENLDREAMRKGARHAHIGLVAELDAEPDLGHSTGHNQGVAAILTAATGIAGALEHVNAIVTVYGCPGTTGNDGLIALAKAGIFEEPDVILGAQPASTGKGFFYTINDTGTTRGSLTVTITLSGDADPTVVEGAVGQLVTALEAASGSLGEHETLTVTSYATSVTGTIEALSRRRLTEIAVDMQLAANDIGGPLELTASLTPSNVYDEMVVSRVLARRMKTFTDNFGPRLDKIRKGGVSDPTPWGNVSYHSPTFVAHYPIVEREVTVGTADFASATNAPEAYDASIQIGQSLALTSLDVIRDDTFRAIADDQLVHAMAERGIERAHRRWTGLHPVLPKQKDPNEDAAAKGPRVTEMKWVRGPGLPN